MKLHWKILSFLSVLALILSGLFIYSLLNAEKGKNIITVENSANSTERAVFSFQAKQTPAFLKDKKDEFILTGQNFIEANLPEMKLRLYKNGQIEKEFPILIVGKKDSWGQTAAGVFKIMEKQRNHFSSLGNVYQPWSMRFWGNFYIHGWPYYAGGELTQRSFSSGCINLTTQDAEELYESVKINEPVLVFGENFSNDDFAYDFSKITSTPSGISAETYLAADLKNGFVFLEKNPEQILPIASITKLMSALISSEYFFLSYQPEQMTYITINKKMLEPVGEFSQISEGKNFSYFDLLYPMLMVSSNDAAEALAQTFGKNFINVMNERAVSLGMNNTHFADSYGYDPANVSTAKDLYYLAKYLVSNRIWLLDISRGKIYEDFGPLAFKNIPNTVNLFADQPDFIGGKVGATPVAWKTGVFLFNIAVSGETRPIAIIVLKSEDNKKDVEIILNWVKENFTNKQNDKNVFSKKNN